MNFFSRDTVELKSVHRVVFMDFFFLWMLHVEYFYAYMLMEGYSSFFLLKGHVSRINNSKQKHIIWIFYTYTQK